MAFDVPVDALAKCLQRPPNFNRNLKRTTHSGETPHLVTRYRAGRSGDRIPVGRREFPQHVQTGPGTHPALHPGLSWG